jgi:A/G-specific adenine glycosylase
MKIANCKLKIAERPRSRTEHGSQEGDSEQLPGSAWQRSFRRRLLVWYGRHARDLPWRRRRDPYAVWVSEIMLQQTQVATVKPYFERFLKTFPTIGALAAADEHDVLRLWEGLGYYRRAQQLHKAARLVVSDYGGQFPRDPQTVRRLPGIGRYTAGAILSIAFNLRQPILEANTVRLFARLLAYQRDPRSVEGRRLLWAMAEAVLPDRDAGTFNQAIMELGSEVCAARAPQCETCPAILLCRANQQGRQLEIPPPKAKRPVEAVREAAVVVRRGARVLLWRRPNSGRWAGLWDFPRFALDGQSPTAIHRELIENVRSLCGVTAAIQKHVATLTHGVTRFRITLECYEARHVSHETAAATQPETGWFRPAELDDLPLSSTGRQLAEIIQKCSPQRTQRRKRQSANH